MADPITAKEIEKAMTKKVEAGDGLAKHIIESGQPRTLLQRLQAVRKDVTYIQKDELPGSAPYGSAVSHASLLKKIRASMVEQGILWFPIKVEVLQSHRYENLEAVGRAKVQYWVEMMITTRFCVAEGCIQHSDFIDIPVLVHGLDSQDKGPGKASTYADKIALLRVLNLESGDDPDFDERDILPEMSDERAAKIANIKRLSGHVGSVLEEYISDKVAWYGAKYSRKVATIAGLPDEVLDKWIAALEKKS